jgi:hypothetical protein
MAGVRCAWRIVISPMIPQDFPSCYYLSMRNLAVLVIHLIGTLARLLGPGGIRSLVAESLLQKHQLLIVNRSRQRSLNLSAGDRILAGLLALLVRPTRLLRSAIELKPSTLLAACFSCSFVFLRYSMASRGSRIENTSFFDSTTAATSKSLLSPLSTTSFE